MAKIRSGVLGNTRGKVAGVVGSQWKNVNYLREYVKPANPNTAAQQVQRGKMSDCVSFSKPLVGPVFNAYTDRFQKGMSGFNYFTKQNIAEFDGSIDYSALKLTEGKLYAPPLTIAEYNDDTDQIEITFGVGLGNNGAATDKIYAAVLHVPTNVWSFPSVEVARSDAATGCDVISGATATDFEAYIWAAQYSGTIVDIISDSNHIQAVDD